MGVKSCSSLLFPLFGIAPGPELNRIIDKPMDTENTHTKLHDKQEKYDNGHESIYNYGIDLIF